MKDWPIGYEPTIDDFVIALGKRGRCKRCSWDLRTNLCVDRSYGEPDFRDELVSRHPQRDVK